MKRTTRFIAALLLTLAAAPAGAFDLSVMRFQAWEQNDTFQELGEKKAYGTGFLAGVELLLGFHPQLLVDTMEGANGNWDPTEGDYVPWNGGGPLYTGEIHSTLRQRWVGGRLGWGRRIALHRDDANLRLYGFVGLAQVTATLELADEYVSESQTRKRLGWLSGVGIEWMEADGLDPDNEMVGLFLELSRRDFNVDFPNVGSGFGSRLSHAWSGSVGISIYPGRFLESERP